MKEEEVTIAKQIIIDELKEQSHPERVEDVIFWALEYYSQNKKGTQGSAIAYYLVERIKEEENKALGKDDVHE